MDPEQNVASATKEGAVGVLAEERAEATPIITMYTTTWCSDCVAAKRYLDAKGIAYQEVDIEQDEDAAELVMRVNGGKRSVPTLVAGRAAASLSGFSIRKAQEFLGAAGLAGE